MTPTRSIATIANALDAALVYFAERMNYDESVLDLHTEIEQAQAALEELRKESCPACSDQPVIMSR